MALGGHLGFEGGGHAGMFQGLAYGHLGGGGGGACMQGCFRVQRVATSLYPHPSAPPTPTRSRWPPMTKWGREDGWGPGWAPPHLPRDLSGPAPAGQERSAVPSSPGTLPTDSNHGLMGNGGLPLWWEEPHQHCDAYRCIYGHYG